MRYTWSSISKGVLLSLLVILLMSPGSLWAGTTGKIAGVVSDESTGDALVGANVFLEGTAMGSSTDEDGFYFINNIPPGTFSVTVSYVGYDKMTKSNVSVMVDRTTDLEFSLNPAPIEGDAITAADEQPPGGSGSGTLLPLPCAPAEDTLSSHRLSQRRKSNAKRPVDP